MRKLILSPWGRLGDEITTIVAASAIEKIRGVKFQRVLWVLWYQNRLQSKPLNICEGKPVRFNWRYVARNFDPANKSNLLRSTAFFRILIAFGVRFDKLKRILNRTEFFTNGNIEMPIDIQGSNLVEINVSNMSVDLAILGVKNLAQVALRNPDQTDLNFLKKVKNSRTICLHIRRGDTVGDAKRGVLDSEYWLNAVSVISQGTDLSEFSLLVFTDDHLGALKTIEKFSDNLKEVEFTPFLDEPARDFVLMANASNLLIANSAFSRWAGVFNSVHNKGRVISPSQINMIEKGWGLQEWEYVAVSWY
ncbi:Glycosyl transferase, family 11 [Candidatus Planktophila versatilis]|uniref:alpha-1,2-fucosyltransferase n=1 Tax=Candidatus Planktophila versatilis TaxID=1884905 RepID=UPI003BEF426C